jgi:hypothetical protein
MHARLVDASQAALADFAEHSAAAGAHDAVLAAVGATGFAPAAGDTVEAVRALRAAGVDAQPGWEVLRELAHDRAALARALRSDDVAVLAAGVVVPPADLQRVRDLLDRGDLTTAAVVAVADPPAVAAALERASGAAEGPAADGARLPARVPADPALFDRHAAADARSRHERHAADARDQAGAARAAAEADRALAARLRELLDRYPAHELTRLESEETQAAAERRRAADLVTAAGEEQRALTARLDELAPLAQEHEAAARRARAAGVALQRAAALLADAAGHERSAAAAADDAAAAHDLADRRTAEAAARRAEVTGLEDRHREAVAGLAQLREEREQVQVLAPDEPPEDLPDGLADGLADGLRQPGNGGTLDRLRAAYAGLHREWESQTSASQAAQRLADAEQRRLRLRERLPGDAGLVGAAEALLAGPDGATAAAQTAAAQRAHDAALAAESDRSAAKVELERADAEVRARRPRDRESHATLPERPATREAAQAGAAEARERAAALERSIAELTAEHETLARRADRVSNAADSLRAKALQLDAGRQAVDAAAGPDAGSGGPGPEADGDLMHVPVDQDLVTDLLGLEDGVRAQDGRGGDRPGSSSDADGRAPAVRAHDQAAIAEGRRVAELEVKEALADENAYGEAVTSAAAKVTAASTALRRLGAQAEFKDVPDAIRNRVLADDTATLLEHAVTLAPDLRQRAALIAQQLGDLAVDTDLVVSRLVTAVRDVLADLGKAERYARMPAGTGTWSERSFLTIRTGPPPDAATVADRLRPVLERFAASPDTLVPMALLKECVLAGAGGPQAFRVKVLKPNAPGQEPEDITKLQKFSGGEKLTVCVALYCVLAKLRAHNAGQEGGGGTLVLDNPLGTASHTRLLALQRKVAAAHGVQLVYATGVNDLGAVGEFAHRVRLRKTWHAAVGRSYVDAVDEEPMTISGAHVGRNET